MAEGPSYGAGAGDVCSPGMLSQTTNVKTAACVERAPEVQEQIERLDREVSRALNLRDRMADRLTSVMREAPPSNQVAPPHSMPETQVATALYRLGSLLSDANDSIESMLSRIEL